MKINNIKGEDSRKEYAMTVESRVEGQWSEMQNKIIYKARMTEKDAP